MKTYVILL